MSLVRMVVTPARYCDGMTNEETIQIRAFRKAYRKRMSLDGPIAKFLDGNADTHAATLQRLGAESIVAGAVRSLAGKHLSDGEMMAK